MKSQIGNKYINLFISVGYAQLRISDCKYMIYDLMCLFSQGKTAYIRNISAIGMSKHSETSLHLEKNELLEALISNNLLCYWLIHALCS